MNIVEATLGDIDQWLALRIALWPDEAGLAEDIPEMIADPDTIAFLARDDAGAPIAFVEAALRHDYVNGCATSPVVFLEGIYVAPDFRRQGLARTLVEKIAAWGRARGCTEFASDILLGNDTSHRMHTALGFAETERVVYFRKML